MKESLQLVINPKPLFNSPRSHMILKAYPKNKYDL